jgi:hypothetical protein
VQVYPDAHNPELRAFGQPTQYCFQPSQVYLAGKHDSPDDFDFQMTVFKGLLSADRVLEKLSTEVGHAPGEQLATVDLVERDLASAVWNGDDSFVTSWPDGTIRVDAD